MGINNNIADDPRASFSSKIIYYLGHRFKSLHLQICNCKKVLKSYFLFVFFFKLSVFNMNTTYITPLIVLLETTETTYITLLVVFLETTKKKSVLSIISISDNISLKLFSNLK